MSHRREQIESTLHRAVSQVLVRDLSDPRIRGLVSVTRVELSEDMRDLRVWVSVLPAKFGPRSVAGLRAAAAHVHRHVCALVDLRTVPHLRFELDKELEKQESIYDAINRGLDREGITSSDVKHVIDPPPVESDDDLDDDDEDSEDDAVDEVDADVDQSDDDDEKGSQGKDSKSKTDRGRRRHREEEDEAEAHA